MATLTELIRQEDPKRPYTDEQLAQMLQLRREQVVELRRINGIPNSWMRLRPALVVEMQKKLREAGQSWELAKGFDGSAAIGEWATMSRAIW